MKLEAIRFCDYKPFPSPGGGDRDLQELELKPLTLVFGKNNSGKSAATRLPRLLLGGLACRTDEILPLEVRGLKYGHRFLDLIHGGDFFRRPSFGLVAEHQGEILDLSLTLFSRGALAEDEAPLVWDYQMRSPETIEHPGPPAEEHGWAGFAGLLPAGGKRWNTWREAASDLLDRMIHLGPMRASIQSSYSEERPRPLGLAGAEAPQWLRYAPTLADEAGDWMDRHLEGWRLSVSRSNDTFSLRIRRSKHLGSNLANAGEGLQQVLPVVVHQLLRQQQDPGPFLDVVEQPELHLHDAAQAPLADLFIDTALRGEGQTIVETHSEPLLLRVQRRVAEGRISHDLIALYFVETSDKGSTLKRIHLNEVGEVDWWPEGVFEEDFQEVAAFRRAVRHRGESGSVG